MVSLVLFGKSDLLEKISWCKKYSKADEEKRVQSARIELAPDFETMIEVSDPQLDVRKLKKHLDPLNMGLANGEDTEVISGRLFKKILFYVLFDQVERIPGKPDYEYGIGFTIETYPIFFEDKLYKEVETVNVVKKMGGLMKETVKSKEKKLRSSREVFGDILPEESSSMAVVGKEKDNRGNLKYALKVTHNGSMFAGETHIPEKLNLTYKSDDEFISQLVALIKKAESVIQGVYKEIGYNPIPEYSLLVGFMTKGRAIEKMASSRIDETSIVDVIYE